MQTEEEAVESFREFEVELDERKRRAVASFVRVSAPAIRAAVSDAFSARYWRNAFEKIMSEIFEKFFESVRLPDTDIPFAGESSDSFVKSFCRSEVKRYVQLIASSKMQNFEFETVRNSLGDEKTGLIASSIKNVQKIVAAVETSAYQAERVESAKDAGFTTYRFVATLDERTTPLCRSLHDRVFTFGGGPIPPLHFYCRSIIVFGS